MTLDQQTKSEDELYLELVNDSEIESDKIMGIVSQNSDEDILAFSVQGLFTDDKKQTKYNPQRILEKNPPVLKISSSDGQEVEFKLTKEITRLLNNSLSEVNKAYSGYRYSIESENKSFRDKIKDLPNYVQKHPLKSLGSVLAGAIIIWLILF